MKLHPRRPPGRIDRKAAAYADDIAELRGAGYTYEAIREALLDVGIVASTSALRREVLRRLRRPIRAAMHPAPGPPQSALPHAVLQPSRLDPPDGPPRAPDGGDLDSLPGRDAAQAFFSAHRSNPLLQSQESP